MNSVTANQPFVFTPGASATVATVDPLVDQTRREIAEIVREVAAAAASDRSADGFLALLVDRTLRAMAAEGVIVWQRVVASSDDDTASAWKPLARIGQITDASLPADGMAAHEQLLQAVASDGQPVVVPATPGATDPNKPANPTSVPVALVPIDTDHSVSAGHLLEVFLESEGSVATTRGYLRFVAQMADLAGEFLRSDQLRKLKKLHTLAGHVDDAAKRMHSQTDKKKLEAMIVDTIAELFHFQRVGLCYLRRRAQLAAVSHVTSIDGHSAGANQMRDAAMTALDSEGCYWGTGCYRGVEVDSDHGPAESVGESDTDGEDRFVLRSVIGVGEESSVRVVCFRRVGDPVSSAEEREQLVRLARHAEIALRHAARWESIPASRLLKTLAPNSAAHAGSRLGRLVKVGLALAVAMLALVPMPMKVHTTATIRAADVQWLCAPREAMVQEIHVLHGQRVSAGETLMTLSDPLLQEQIATLKGDRAVLEQKRTRLRQQLVDHSTPRGDTSEQTQDELSLVSEEIDSIQQQLVLRERIRDSLQLRADRDGYVDAWQIRERLDRRPLQRGDLLLKVIALESAWDVDADVPQSRISHVQEAWADDSLEISVALAAQPNQVFDASLSKFGPAARNDSNESLGAAAVMLRLSDDAAAYVASSPAEIQSGSPAHVMFHCGSAPAGYLLFQDLIRSVQATVRLYLSATPPETVDLGVDS